MFREIGGNYYNDLMFQKVIATDGNYYIEFSGGSRLGITQSEYQAIIENGYVVIGNVHYNKELISKVYTATNGKYYAEFTNGETMVLTQVEYQNIIDGSGKKHKDLVRTYSDDETKMLLQVETGITYDDAIDTYPCKYTYEEIDKQIEEEAEE